MRSPWRAFRAWWRLVVRCQCEHAYRLHDPWAGQCLYTVTCGCKHWRPRWVEVLRLRLGRLGRALHV